MVDGTTSQRQQHPQEHQQRQRQPATGNGNRQQATATGSGHPTGGLNKDKGGAKLGENGDGHQQLEFWANFRNGP